MVASIVSKLILNWWFTSGGEAKLLSDTVHKKLRQIKILKWLTQQQLLFKILGISMFNEPQQTSTTFVALTNYPIIDISWVNN